MLLTGCADLRERGTEALDTAEAEARATRQAYQDRLDRISREWWCSGMAYADFVAAAGGVQQAADLHNQLCVAEGVQ